jgi:phospholipase C
MAAVIKHLIVLMMENRSFDHMFGFLKIENPAVPDDAIDALKGNETNPNVDGTTVAVSADARYAGDFRDDPGHLFPDVNVQLFGVDPTPAGALATNQGFVKSYAAHVKNDPSKAGRVMKCFSPERIPVLTGLAQQFAVCDRWFSSLPGPTLPNRAFAHAATSNGHVDMNPVAYWGVPTLYEALDKVNVSSKVYSFDGNTLAFMFKKLFAGGNKFLGAYDDFLNDLDGNNLPVYCFLEPRFNDWYDQSTDQNYFATDQHPDNHVDLGDAFIADVYEAIRASKYWTDSLFVVVYDEHGGLFDHVRPPTGVPNPGPVNADTGFDFTRLGLRVPAVLISPYTKPGTIVHTQFDHTSLAATVRKLLAPAMPALTARDQAANTFDEVLNLDVPRNDAPMKLNRVPAVFRSDSNVHGSGALNEHQLTQLLAAYHVDMLQPADRRVMGRLVGARTIQDLNTEQLAAEYIQKVAANTAPAAFGPQP